MNKVLLGVLSLAVVTVAAPPASAADIRMPVKPSAMAAAPNWAGFYVGAHAGHTWGSSDISTTHLPSQAAFNADPFGQTTDVNGFLGGVQAGYNWQASALVFGIEADISWSGANGTGTVAPLPLFGGTPLANSWQTVTTELDWFGTARLRAGFAVTPPLLLYVTGGVAFGSVRQSVVTGYTPNLAALIFTGTTSDTRTGWTVGGGAEWAMTSNWSVKAEYLYYDLGNATIVANPLAPNPTLAVRTEHDLTGHIARLGVNYRF